MTVDFALQLASAAARVLAPDGGTVLIGKDTRLSGYMFESALEAGFVAAGVDVMLIGPLPTPGIAYMTRRFDCDFGVVISASHNLYDDNGIKFFDAEGGKLSEIELLSSCITLLVAGHETTTSLIGNGLYALLSHPQQWQLLKHDPSLLPSALEEMLRYESPVARQPRLMKRDAEMGGKRLREGQMVFQMLNAANRDPDYFPEPDRFDIRRQKNPHLAFGLGVHFCVGATLARTEGVVVFTALMARLPGIRLVDEKPHWDLQKPNSRMMKTLWVDF